MKISGQLKIFLIFIPIFFLRLLSFSQTGEEQNALFTLKGKIELNDKPIDGVSLELIKDGKQIKKILTTKTGKYSFTMNQNTVNQKNEYTINISKEGTVPKTLIINTYVPKEQYDDNPYEYVLEISLVPTTILDVVLQRPSGKIKWDASKNAFDIDQVYAKIIQKEEEKLEVDPDKYLKELAEKMNKETEDAKKKADDLAKQKTVEAVNEIAKQKESEMIIKPEIVAQQDQSTIITEIKDQTKADTSVTSIQKKEVPPPLITTPKKQEVYDGTIVFSRNVDKKVLKTAKEKAEKKKTANLATKYDTSNILTSLLNVVDEHDKQLKKQ